MTSLREFILQQSALTTGNLVRDHVNNPGLGGDSNVYILADGLGVEVMSNDVEIVIEDDAVEVDVFNDETLVTIESSELSVEISNGN